MLRQFVWIACGVLLGFSSIGVAAADTPIDLKNHKPQFRWNTGPDGRQRIYDGEMLVADFYPGPKGPKAMQGIGRPISLHNLRLIPGGPPAINKGEGCGPLCLSWRKHLMKSRRFSSFPGGTSQTALSEKWQMTDRKI